MAAEVGATGTAGARDALRLRYGSLDEALAALAGSTLPGWCSGDGPAVLANGRVPLAEALAGGAPTVERPVTLPVDPERAWTAAPDWFAGLAGFFQGGFFAEGRGSLALEARGAVAPSALEAAAAAGVTVPAGLGPFRAAVAVGEGLLARRFGGEGAGARGWLADQGDLLDAAAEQGVELAEARLRGELALAAGASASGKLLEEVAGTARAAGAFVVDREVDPADRRLAELAVAGGFGGSWQG